MPKYIDAEIALKESFEIFTQEYGMIEVVAVDVINEQPTADVKEVVYCKNCVLHGRCVTEKAFEIATIGDPFCCAGKKAL